MNVEIGKIFVNIHHRRTSQLSNFAYWIVFKQHHAYTGKSMQYRNTKF